MRSFPAQVADTGIVLEMKEDGDFTKLRGSVRGPPDTPYHGGTFDLDIKVLDTYPFHPPQVSWLLSSSRLIQRCFVGLL